MEIYQRAWRPLRRTRSREHINTWNAMSCQTPVARVSPRAQAQSQARGSILLLSCAPSPRQPCPPCTSGFAQRLLHTSNPGTGRSNCSRCPAPVCTHAFVCAHVRALLARASPSRGVRTRRSALRTAAAYGAADRAAGRERTGWGQTTLCSPVVRIRSSMGPSVTFTTELKR